MQFNRSSFAKFLSVFVVLAMLAAAGALSIQPTLAQQGADKAEAEEQSARQTPGNPDTSAEPPREVQVHLGYDKATGKSLPDPTIIENPAYSPADLALLQQQADEKLAAIDATQIRFRSGYEVHPQPGIAPEVLEQLSRPVEAAGEDGHYVVQFRYPVPTQARRDLESAGMTFYDDLDTGAALAKVPSKALDGLQKLARDGTVRYVGSIPWEARLSPSLADLMAKEPDGSSDIVLLTFDEPTQAQLDELSEWFKVERRSDGPMHILEGKVVHAGLQRMASLDYVRWIEPDTLYELGNLEGGMAMGADLIRLAGFPGTGVNVSVIDTGIARSGTTYHPDLLAGRIVDQWDYQNDDSNAADDYNHGTHVAGSIGGRYNSSNANSERAFQGVAPGVNFYIYKLCCGAGQFSNTWFQQALQRGTSGGRVTHISNNSWGGGNGVYTIASEIADRAVRGEYNGEPINMVIISHNDNALTRAPGTAKNAITVGSVKDGSVPNTPFTSCSGVPDYDWPPAQRVCYSNYGPLDTDGNGFTRVKPDIMATGAMIRSAVPWYNFDDSRYYNYDHGTSMAAPHVAGAIAQFLDHFSVANPQLFDWPEAVKAWVLTTAMNVGNDVNKYGRGLLDAYHMNWYQPGIQEQPHLWTNSIGSSNQSIDFTFSVPAGYQEVVVALTWSDPAGATEAINDLDISYVKDGSGTTQGFSTREDDNVEFVRVPDGGAGGTWTVRVYGFSLASAQTFGLAVNPILKKASLSIDGTVEYIGPPAFAVNPGNTFYFHQYVSNSGYAAGGAYAHLIVPAGFTVEGAQIYTNDGASYFYDDTEIYHMGSSDWRAALGAAIAGTGNTRHVRWLIRANSNAACGPHSFVNEARYTQAGSLTASPPNTDVVAVTCRVYLPLIRRQ
jgi:subtilisin family serine protease